MVKTFFSLISCSRKKVFCQMTCIIPADHTPMAGTVNEPAYGSIVHPGEFRKGIVFPHKDMEHSSYCPAVGDDEDFSFRMFQGKSFKKLSDPCKNLITALSAGNFCLIAGIEKSPETTIIDFFDLCKGLILPLSQMPLPQSFICRDGKMGNDFCCGHHRSGKITGISKSKIFLRKAYCGQVRLKQTCFIQGDIGLPLNGAGKIISGFAMSDNTDFQTHTISSYIYFLYIIENWIIPIRRRGGSTGIIPLQETAAIRKNTAARDRSRTRISCGISRNVIALNF